MGTDSNVKFWTNNWVGYPLSSKINLPKGSQLDARDRDFHLQDRWIILDIFGSLFPGIV